jgi:ABC-type nitrate/sulfonate/bicarbonate transport system, ATPase component
MAVSIDRASVARTNSHQRIFAENVGLVYKIKQAKKDDKKTLTALEGVNLSVRDGEFLSIVGPSGCGKSTFLYILAGLIKKTSGTVYIDGREIKGPALDRGIVMQGYALFPWRTIQKNIEFGLEVKGTKKSERAKISREYLELVGLKGFEDRYPYELSGGMKQRVAIARALAYDPEVLLMDEPFAAIDEQTKDTLHEELLRIWEKTHKTIIFVTHSIDEAVFLSDRIAVMTPSPGTIKAIVDVNLDRPRYNASLKASIEFTLLRQKVWDLLHNETDERPPIPNGVRISDVISDSAII